MQSVTPLLLLALLCVLVTPAFAQQAGVSPGGINPNMQAPPLPGQQLPPAAASTNSNQPKNIYNSALTFQVEPREELCFYEDLAANQNFHMEFEVIKGGLLDINLRIHDPYNQPIRERLAFFNRPDDKINEQEGTIDFPVRAGGTYRICFDNQMSRWTPKVISFFVSDGSAPAKDQHSDIAKLTHLGPIVDSVISIADKLDAVETLQHHMRVREQLHRDSIESNNSRVAWMAVLETIVLLVLVAVQIRSIMSWFADKKKFARV